MVPVELLGIVRRSAWHGQFQYSGVTELMSGQVSRKGETVGRLQAEFGKQAMQIEALRSKLAGLEGKVWPPCCI